MSDMVEVQTGDLIDIALDWVVDGIESGKPLEIRHHKSGNGEWIFVHGDVPYPQGPRKFSSDWSALGPLIKKYPIVIGNHESGDPERPGEFWGSAHCYISGTRFDTWKGVEVAACRSIVAYKLGQSVMVPKELLQ